MASEPAALEAARLEDQGDLLGAASAWRRHLGVEPGDRGARLRLGRVLVAAGDLEGARRALLALDEDDDEVAAAANALLAELDESDGAYTEAARRWERMLGFDIDDSHARARLQALRPEVSAAGPRSTQETMDLPAGAHAMRFVLVRELGRGATAAVYLARDSVLDIMVALKILHPHMAGAAQQTARARFFAEARLLAGLRHPGVVAIYDIDEPTRSLAMELVSGGSLRARLRALSPAGLPAAETLGVARTLLAVVAHLHAHDVVHGDIKPGNLLLRRPGEVVLADFGSAHLRAGSASEDETAGTPLYLAPEQFRGAASGPATDLFSVGAVLWECLAGRPLRTEIDLVNENLRAIDRPPVDVSDPTLLGLVDAAMALLDVRPDARPAASELLRALPVRIHERPSS